MRVLLEETRVFLSYGTAWIVCGEPGDLHPEPDEPWAGESNGLCGASVPNFLDLQTGTHTGNVPFRIELHDTAPPLGDRWEEIVEVSFVASSEELHLIGLMGDPVFFRLPLGDYRVRYCADGFEDADTTDEVSDTYLLQFWPAPPSPGRIVRTTGEQAAYWHRHRRALTAEER